MKVEKIISLVFLVSMTFVLSLSYTFGQLWVMGLYGCSCAIFGISWFNK